MTSIPKTGNPTIDRLIDEMEKVTGELDAAAKAALETTIFDYQVFEDVAKSNDGKLPTAIMPEHYVKALAITVMTVFQQLPKEIAYSLGKAFIQSVASGFWLGSLYGSGQRDLTQPVDPKKIFPDNEKLQDLAEIIQHSIVDPLHRTCEEEQVNDVLSLLRDLGVEVVIMEKRDRQEAPTNN